MVADYLCRLLIEIHQSGNQGDLVSVNIFKGIFRFEHDPKKQKPLSTGH